MTMPMTAEPSSADALSLVRQQFTLTRQQLAEVVDANKALIDAKTATYEATGQVTFATAFIFGTTECLLTFEGGTKLRFYGKDWGVGLGAGTSYGAAIFAVPPQSLLGECSFQVSFVSGGVGGVVVHWLRGLTLLGTFAGGSLGLGASSTGGSGVWTTR